MNCQAARWRLNANKPPRRNRGSNLRKRGAVEDAASRAVVEATERRRRRCDVAERATVFATDGGS